MAYDTSKLVTLGHLKDLAERVKSGFATQAEFDELQSLVDGLVTEGGEPNIIDKILVNGVAQDVEDKAVDITVPTKTSDLENDSDFQSKEEIDTELEDVLRDSDVAEDEEVTEMLDEVIGTDDTGDTGDTGDTP